MCTLPSKVMAVDCCLDDDEFNLLTCKVIFPFVTSISKEPSTPIIDTSPFSVKTCVSWSSRNKNAIFSISGQRLIIFFCCPLFN